MDGESINNCMVDNRIRFLENRDNNPRWCDPDVSKFKQKLKTLHLAIQNNKTKKKTTWYMVLD